MTNSRETAIKNVLRGALIRRQVDNVPLLQPVKDADELREGRARSASEVIDGLVGIADRKHILLSSREHPCQLDLRMVRVLKFVDQQETCFELFPCQQRSIAPE